jgi:two-component system, chemotaxis family, CheB/CheR fusion protein
MSGEPTGTDPSRAAATACRGVQGSLPLDASTPVVAVGASAGGVDALKRLLGALPVGTNLSVVVVQHLSPSHDSLLTSALGTATQLPVVEVRDGMRIEAGRVHVIPPNTTLVLEGDELRLHARDQSARPPLPIDAFMRSVALRGERAIGVVLSGAGGDGTEGLKAIQMGGGRTYAQAPSTAVHDSMPRSAIAADAVDLILPPEEIARGLVALAAGAAPPSAAEGAAPEQDGPFRQLIQLLKVKLGVDVSQYKPSTLRRRIARRAALVRASGLREYLERVRADDAELTALHDDLFIHVTSFFRDPEVFAALDDRVFPALVAARGTGGAPIRVWVPGCASGEETYSLAISLLEHLEGRGIALPIQVFGSDISDRAIRRARAAEYDPSISERVSPQRLERYFERTRGGYRIKPFVRESCVFVRHDLTADPPFSRIDLLSCRNVLIYFNAALQKLVLPLFHYALNDPGYLVLGRTEALSGTGELFTTVDSQHRIYARVPGREGLRPTPPRPVGGPPRAVAATPSAGAHALDAHRALDALLLSRYAPAAVLVNDALDIIQVRGKTGPFLEPASGAASLNLLGMARGGLGADLTLLVQRARAENGPVRKKGVRLDEDGAVSWVDLEVAPFESASLPGRHFVVIFREQERAPDAPRTARPPPGAEEPALVVELREALSASQAYVSSVTEQYAVTNQALAESNEQLQTANEELQSANEELETAKEELQSSNEELTTVNDELQGRYQEVRELGNDLQNLVSSVDIPIVIVDRARRIRRFTPKARLAFNLIAGDVGRAISDIRPNVEAPELDAWIAEAIENATSREAEVRDLGGRWQRVQIRPYQTADRRIDGAVVALVDIDTLKSAVADAQRARDFLATLLGTVPAPVLVLDHALRVTSANEAFHRAFDVPPAGVLGRLLGEVDSAPCRSPALAARLADTVARGIPFQDVELECELPGGKGRAIYAVSARALREGDGEPRSVVLAIQDVTEVRRNAEARTRASAEEAQQFLVEAGAAMLPSSLDYQATLAVLAHVVVPRLADWCVIDLVEPDGTIRQAAAAHVDREKERLAQALRRRFPPESQPERGVAWVIRTGKPLLYPQVEDPRWLAAALGAEHPDFLRELGARSYLAVPLRGRNGVIGALSLARGLPGRRYGPGDVTMTEDLGQRAGLAVENARLYLAMRDAVVARDEFLAILSHELRNPLAPLRNSLNILDRADLAGPQGPQARRALEVAQRQVEHVTRLVDDLLDVTRIAHGKIDLHRTDVDLADLVRGAAEDHRAVIEARGVRLSVVTPQERVFVHGDPTRIVQIVGNLLQNAAKFTRAGDAVTLSLVRADASAEIRVRDTGAGIEPAVLKALFHPFTQAKQTLARTEGGLGLGLAFVKGLVELHGGTVSAASEGAGRGSEFTVRLPLVEPARDASGGGAGTPASPAMRRRVLVVDDNHDSAQTLADLVRMLGHDAEVAFDGPSAVALARATPPDIIFCDIGLPGMTGYDVAKALREGGLRDTRLVAVTGYARPEDVKRATEAGFDAHLAKPVDLPDIERVLV